MILRPLPFITAFVCAITFLPAIGAADEAFEAMEAAAMKNVATIEGDALTKEAALSKKYTEVLQGLETKLAAEGNLDLILRVREERTAVEKEGHTTASKDEPITDLREKYLTARSAIRAELETSRAKIVEDIRKSVKEQEVTLTKAGRVEEAMALRKEGAQLIAAITDFSAAAPASNATRPAALDAAANAKAVEAARGKVFRFILADHPEVALAGERDKPLGTEKKGSGIRIIAALAEADLTDPARVTLELESGKDVVLRHINYKLRCEKVALKPDALLRKDATFRMLHGTDGTVRFEAVNFPGRFINLADDGSITIRQNPPPGRCRFRLEAQ